MVARGTPLISEAVEASLCPLCERPLGKRVERHHLVPRSRGGGDVIEVHPICHRKIHSVFGTRELAAVYHEVASLRAHPEIAAFVRWLAGKHPDFHKATRGPRKR